MQYVKLNNQHMMPGFGLGTWEVPGKVTADVVYAGLCAGYRLVDTATMYGNEKECSDGIERWVAEGHGRRDDIFYITKLWEDEKGAAAPAAIAQALQKAPHGKIDLLLMHSPLGGREARLSTWKAMEDAVGHGVEALGVSNFGVAHLQELVDWPQLRIAPVANEIEVSPRCMRSQLCDFTRKLGLAVIAYAPLGHAGALNDAEVLKVAGETGRSPAQVLLRWAIQSDLVPIPKTATVSRLKENLDVWDFTLSEQQMQLVSQPQVHEPSDWEVTECE